MTSQETWQTLQDNQSRIAQLERQLAEAKEQARLAHSDWLITQQELAEAREGDASMSVWWLEREEELERQLAEAKEQARLAHSDWLITQQELAEANAALAEAVKGLTIISEITLQYPRELAREALARIEALKVQPEVAQ